MIIPVAAASGQDRPATIGGYRSTQYLMAWLIIELVQQSKTAMIFELFGKIYQNGPSNPEKRQVSYGLVLARDTTLDDSLTLTKALNEVYRESLRDERFSSRKRDLPSQVNIARKTEMAYAAVKGEYFMDMLWLVGIIVGWIVLNRWVLPRLGVQT